MAPTENEEEEIRPNPLTHRLMAFRKFRGMSQAEAAELAEVTEKTWSRWETGRYLPSSWETLAKGLRYQNFDDFFLAYCQFCVRHPEITSEGQRQEGAKASESAPPRLESWVLPRLPELLREVLEADLQVIQAEDWRAHLEGHQASLLARAGQLLQDFRRFLWIFGKIRKRRAD